MLGGTLPGCKWITWSWSWAGGRPLGISPNTLEYLLITISMSNGVEDIVVWTSIEHNYATTPRCSFLSNFVMILEIITLERFHWIPLSSISFPSEKSLLKRSWKLRASVPNDYNHWTHNTTSTPPIWMEIIGLSKKYFPILSLILWNFLKQFMAPLYGIITWNSSVVNTKQLRFFANL